MSQSKTVYTKQIYNNKPVLDYINKNNSYIKSINVFDFENLFGSIPHRDIVKVCSDIYDDFNSILNCDKSYWINLVKFCIFENNLYNGKDYFLQNIICNKKQLI